MPDTFAAFTIATTDGEPDDPRSLAVSRTWIIPPGSADAWAGWLTAEFGEPTTTMQHVGDFGTTNGEIILEPGATL